jgi:hypothetical protein
VIGSRKDAMRQAQRRLVGEPAIDGCRAATVLVRRV